MEAHCPFCGKKLEAAAEGGQVEMIHCSRSIKISYKEESYCNR